jgi:hypothetical protein
MPHPSTRDCGLARPKLSISASPSTIISNLIPSRLDPRLICLDLAHLFMSGPAQISHCTALRNRWQVCP